MEFHIENLENPFGPAINISGTLPVFLNAGPSPPPNLDADTVKPIVESNVKRYRELFEDLDDTSIRQIVVEGLTLASYFLNHQYSLDAPETEILMDNITGSMRLGGINQSLEYLEECPDIDIGYKNIVRRMRGIVELLDGEDLDEGFDSLVLMVPMIENEILFFKKQIKKLFELRPEARKMSKQLTEDNLGKSSSMLLLLDEKEEGDEEDFTDATFRNIKSQGNGALGTLEIAGILRNLEISPDIRPTFIWDIVKRSFIGATAELMDLLKLKESFSDPKPSLSNSILRRVVKKGGQSLEESIKYAIQNIQAEFHDLKVGIKKCRRYFASDENVLEYLDLMEYYWDGLLQGFASEKFVDSKWLGLHLKMESV